MTAGLQKLIFLHGRAWRICACFVLGEVWSQYFFSSFFNHFTVAALFSFSKSQTVQLCIPKLIIHFTYINLVLFCECTLSECITTHTCNNKKIICLSVYQVWPTMSRCGFKLATIRTQRGYTQMSALYVSAIIRSKYIPAPISPHVHVDISQWIESSRHFKCSRSSVLVWKLFRNLVIMFARSHLNSMPACLSVPKFGSQQQVSSFWDNLD